MLILAALLFTVIRSELIHLGLKNYSMSKKEYSPLLIYYHGSDRNSKKFLPEYELIAQGNHSLQKSTSFPQIINFGIVDSQVESKLMEKTQISDLPTAYLFYGENEKIKYQGAWNAQAFINWIKKTYRDTPQLNEFHPSSLIQKFSQLQTKFSSFNLVAILITPDFRLAPLKSFVNAAKQAPDGYVFSHVHDPEIAKKFGVDRDSSALKIYSKVQDFEEQDDEAQKKWKTFIIDYEGDIRSSDEMLKFLKIHSFKGLFYVDDTKFQKLQRRKDLLPTIMLLYNKTTADEDLVKVVHESRYALLNKAILGLVDVNNDCAERLERLFNINVTTDVPRYVMVKPKSDNNEFFKYKEEFMDPVEFYEAYSEGKLSPFYRTEGVLSGEDLYDKVGLYKLTRDTYHEYLKEQNAKGRDVVVYYTAKKCEPCKDFKPDYNNLFKKFGNKEKLIFTRVDVEQNELNDIQIDTYPHIKLYKAGLDHPLTWHDEKTPENLFKFLQKNSNYGDLLKHEDL